MARMAHSEDAGANAPLLAALGVVASILDDASQRPVELVTFSRGRVCLQPVVMADGEVIARALGCDVPLDHRMFVPGHTLWTGERDGLEVQVRSVLRRPSGVIR